MEVAVLRQLGGDRATLKSLTIRRRRRVVASEGTAERSGAAKADQVPDSLAGFAGERKQNGRFSEAPWEIGSRTIAAIAASRMTKWSYSTSRTPPKYPWWLLQNWSEPLKRPLKPFCVASMPEIVKEPALPGVVPNVQV